MPKQINNFFKASFFCQIIDVIPYMSMTATRGLEGVVATTSSVSSIIDDTLTYVGYNIDDLTEKASFEEVVYLLWHLKLPNKEELAELKKQLSENAGIPKEASLGIPAFSESCFLSSASSSLFGSFKCQSR